MRVLWDACTLKRDNMEGGAWAMGPHLHVTLQNVIKTLPSTYLYDLSSLYYYYFFV